jgi:hypothetical protein
MKTKKVEVRVYVKTPRERAYLNRYTLTHVVGAAVPANIKLLLIEEARLQGLTLSAMIGQALVMYLQDCGTKIEV